MRIIAIIIFFFFLSTAQLCAQVSPAFDPKCYLPRIGVPGEIDTIMGGVDGQGLGSRLMNIGPPPGGSYGSIILKGLPQNIPFLSTVNAGPNFNLHKLDVRKALDFDDQTIIKYGHFHDTKHLDLFSFDPNNGKSPKIYWADDSGNYSKNLVSYLITSRLGDDGYGLLTPPYSAYLTSDTVEDIIISFKIDYLDPQRDTNVLNFYRGGQSLFNKGIAAKEDSMFFMGLIRNNIQGDWRGTGREDLISIDPFGNALYYRNDPSKPFSLAEFYRAVQQDTLFSVWENPHFIGNSFGQSLTMKALPKKNDDKSLDLIITPQTDDNRNGGKWFFRGNTEFGSHRITLDSVAYIIRSPEYYDPTAFNGLYFSGLYNCGDMTGTGNNVLLIGGTFDLGHVGLQFFYVTGEALDDKVDMYYLAEPDGGGPADTLTANSDNLEDVMIGMFELNHYGSLHVVYGSKKIPVRINAVHSGTQPKQSLEIRPNIFSNSTTITLITEHSEPITIFIRDVLGRTVYEEHRYSIGGSENIALRLPLLSSGRYILQVSGANIFASAPITILR